MSTFQGMQGNWKKCVLGVHDSMAGVADCKGLATSLAIDVVPEKCHNIRNQYPVYKLRLLCTTISDEVRRLVDESSSLRVGTSRGCIPKRATEVDASKVIRVYVSVCVWIGASAVKDVFGELAVADVAKVGPDNDLSPKIVLAKPGLVAAAFRPFRLFKLSN